MANPFKGEIEAELGGNVRVLRLGNSEMVELQNFLGGTRGILALSKEINIGGLLEFRESLAVIHFGLRGAGVRQEFSKTEKLTAGMPLSEILQLAAKIVNAAWGANIPEEAAEGNAVAPGGNSSTTSPGAA